MVPQEVAVYQPQTDGDGVPRESQQDVAVGTVVLREMTAEDMSDPVEGDYTGLSLEVNAFLEGDGLVANPMFAHVPVDHEEALRREEGYSHSAGAAQQMDHNDTVSTRE